MSTLVRPSAPSAGASSPATRLATRVRAFDRTDPRALPALGAVSALAAVLYLVNLAVSGYANTYYTMAAQAASQSWSAWFFGSLDASSFITIDKPPLSTMVMGLSVRLFGLSSWSILLPEALMGVAAVAVLFLAVRRSFGTAAATIAGTVMALTPAAVLIFRYDNPDALLTLLLVSAAWALLRALDAGHVRWLALAGALVGLGFMTKFLQAWLVLPAFALVWVVAAPGGWRRRVAGLTVAAGAVAVASLAWPVAVELVPAASRPYVGGSTGNSVFDLILGYDGLGRIFGGVGNGGAGGAGGVGGGGGMFGGAAGILRLFNDQFGGQVSWLIPYALVALASGLWLRRRAGRTDRALAGYLLWGGWLGVHAFVFSFMSGVIHPYYSVILAPAIGALVGAGTLELWHLRSRSRVGGLLLAGALVASGAWAWALLDRTPDFAPGLGTAILAITAAAAILVALPAGGRRRLAAGRDDSGPGSSPGRTGGLRGADDGDGPLRRRPRGRTRFGDRLRRAGWRRWPDGCAALGREPPRREPPRRGHRPGPRERHGLERRRRVGGRGRFRTRGRGRRGGGRCRVDLLSHGPRRIHPLDRGRDRVRHGRRDPAGNGPAGHDDGRLQWLGRRADPRPAEGLRGLRRAPLRAALGRRGRRSVLLDHERT